MCRGGRGCRAGAISGAAGSFAAPWTGGLFPNAKSDTGQLLGGAVLSGAIGGAASVAGGGKFENGAVTAAFGYLFNEMGSYIQRGYEPYVSDDMRYVCNGASDRCIYSGMARQSYVLEGTALVLSSFGAAVRGLFALGEGALTQVTAWNFTRTVSGHLAERPFANSSLLVDEIIAVGKVAPDVVPGLLRYTAPGTRWSASLGAEATASRGTYEVVVDPSTRTVVHFLFRSTK